LCAAAVQKKSILSGRVVFTITMNLLVYVEIVGMIYLITYMKRNRFLYFIFWFLIIAILVASLGYMIGLGDK